MDRIIGMNYEVNSLERMKRLAYQWIRMYDKAPVPEVWVDRIAALCAEFAELMYADYRRQTDAYYELYKEAVLFQEPKLIIADRDR